MTHEEQDLFHYQFIVNIDSYEPKLLFGLTFVELTASGMAMVFPMLLFQNLSGILLGAAAGLVVIALLKRFTRLGNLQLPVYLWKRGRLAWRRENIPLPRLVPAVRASVTVRDYSGEHVATYH